MFYNSDSVESKRCYFVIIEINDREKLSKTINKYIKVLDYAENIFLVSSSANSGVSLFSFITVISTAVGVTSASLVFLSLMEL